MSIVMRARSALLATVLAAAPATAQQSANIQAAENFRFSASEIEALVKARNQLARSIAGVPGLGNQIVGCSQGNPTVNQVISCLQQIPQVKQAFSNQGLTVWQGVMSELALYRTALAYQNSQQNPGAPAITPAMQANLKLYRQYADQFTVWRSEIGGQPIYNPDFINPFGPNADNVVSSPDIQQPGNINAAADPDVKQPGNENLATDPDVKQPGNVNVAKDPDIKQPGNVNVSTDPDMQPASNVPASDPDMVNPIMTDPDNVSP